MIKILFIRNEHAFLPEIDAYVSYFNRTDRFKAYDSSKLQNYQVDDFDVIWEFKGFRGIKPNKHQLLIHEYASLSTGKFPQIKNLIKAKLNIRPNIRVFLNENVKQGFNFNDHVDYCYRDMGIAPEFIEPQSNVKEYDFLYVGAIVKEREIDRLLEVFTAKENGKLYLVGNVDEEIYERFKNEKNLIFAGKVPYTKIPEIMSKAEYGINFIPDKYPFNVQTSTKMLEYLAAGLKVITTDYKWIQQFEQQHGCLFYKLDYQNLTFDQADIEQFEFADNFKASDYMWDKVIKASGIEEMILTNYQAIVSK